MFKRCMCFIVMVFVGCSCMATVVMGSELFGYTLESRSVSAGVVSPQGDVSDDLDADTGFAIGVKAFTNATAIRPDFNKNLLFGASVNIKRMGFSWSEYTGTNYNPSTGMYEDTYDNFDGTVMTVDFIPTVRYMVSTATYPYFGEVGLGLGYQSIDAGDLGSEDATNLVFSLGGGVEINQFEVLANYYKSLGDVEEIGIDAINLVVGYRF